MEEINEFKRFDVVSGDSDHHFLDSPCVREDCFSNAGSEVYKKIMKEWRMLDQNLPESIYVRVYEKRIDLLTAVIVGAADTPYHDGLFFFDIVFPPDYPNSPPKVHYRSFGLRLNPNLYSSGKVCLSLLNTWRGKKSEHWNASESTIFQVLVSIQALVLNGNPYFNEPGNDIFGRTLMEKRSQAYNENVFALNCRTMLFLLQRPPTNFESFVVGHFRERAHPILEACNDYANGHVRVGYQDNGGSYSSPSSVKVSKRFKETMQALYTELVGTFEMIGASLGNSAEQLELETTRPSKKGPLTEKMFDGILKKVVGRIKKVLTMKTCGKIDINWGEGEDTVQFLKVRHSK